MKRSEQLKTKIKQLNVWIIIVMAALLLIISLFNQKILDSDYIAIFFVPAVYKMGLMTIFVLYLMTIIILVNWSYYSLFKITRPNFYDPQQRAELIHILKDPAVQGNIDEFRKRTANLVAHYSNFLSEIIGAILPNAIRQPFMLEQYFRTKVENLVKRFSDGINTINLLSNIAPIIGFFGTLLGLILAFHNSAQAMLTEGQMTPDTFSKLQTSIMIAIITSVYGVGLKIVGSFLRHHLITKVNNFSDELVEIPIDVLFEE